ncbi:YdeI/OmpD-associated family protein [Paraflavitalea pollutisoli]|uniref:YdeI/OmpD-associated family protein n=1 Tax=Paraflavitalea pollutisoli TaxID=3034143 RepID=UPI0023EE1B06|nr:DUF1801 domain-containing protein [Paraflavitalea sp. H1-2-19X]
MPSNATDSQVDAYLSEATQWTKEMQALRAIALDCGLEESLKWGKPCYAFEGKNIVVIQGFKAYCALLFFQGFQLSDPEGILVKTGENTRVGRQVRVNNTKEVTKLAAVLKRYIYEAIELVNAGIKFPPPKQTALKIPEELQAQFSKKKSLRTAFEALTLGRQRAYLIHFSQAKQSSTRTARIEKCTPQILLGKGLNER